MLWRAHGGDSRAIATRRPSGWGNTYVPVPVEAVLNTIEVLCCYLALWQPLASLDPQEQAPQHCGRRLIRRPGRPAGARLDRSGP
jgi:hypothetical protein